MRKGAAKAGLFFLEAIAIVLAVLAAGAAFSYWRLEQGPAALDIVRPSVEFAIERRLPAGYQADVHAIELARSERRGAYLLRLNGVVVRGPDGTEAARAADLRLSFAVGDLLAGKLGPQTVAAEGASFRIVRNAAQVVEIPVTAPRSKKRALPGFGGLFKGGLLESAFERADMSGARITFVDVASGRTWTTDNAHISIGRHEEGLRADIRADMDLGGDAAAIRALAAYDEGSEILTADVSGERFPVGDLLSMFYGDGAAIVDAPVSGNAVIALTADGHVLSSSFSARIDAGRLNLGGSALAVEHIEWETRFDPQTNEFSVDRFSFDVNGSKGELAGAVTLEFGDGVRDPERVSFDLAGEKLTVNLPGFFAQALPVDRAAASGAYHVSERRMALSSVGLGLFDVAATGSFAMTFPRADEQGAMPSPGVEAKLRVDGALDPERLLKLWPLTTAMGARDWVADRLEAARIENIAARVALPPGAIGPDGKIPDEALSVTFDASGAKAYYVEEMTPLSEGSGSGVLRGNSFKLNVDSARVGDVAIDEGEVEFPEFLPKWRPTYFRFRAAGRSEAILGVLDQEPLSLLAKIALSAEQFEGDAVARVEIMRPNKRDVGPDEYRYSGTASFENMRVAGLTGDADLTEAEGKVTLRPRSVTIAAAARLGDAPLDIVWRQNFFAQDGPSTISVAGTVDSTTADLFGVASRSFVRGPVEVSATATGDIGAFETLDLDVDFSAAALSVDALGWRKLPGAPATGRLTMRFSPDGVAIESARIEGNDAVLDGSLSFRSDGALKSANIPRLYFENAADLAVTAERNADGALLLTAVGAYFNAGPLIENVLQGAGGEPDQEGFRWRSGVSATARIDRIALRNGIEYRDATLDFWRDAERLEALNFSALDAAGAPLRVAMAPPADETGAGRSIEARTSEIGDLLNGVFGLTSIRGGEGVMRVNLGELGGEGVTGEVEARNLRVSNAPLLARVFSAGSLDGLASLLNGEGIELTYAYGQFDARKGVLAVEDFRATGPSVGMTAEGAVAMGGGGEISLRGAVAPIYQLNSALGGAPIIGDILVGKKGEGIVALSYSVTGDRGAPAVFVNPLSALTPGIFRNIMQPPRREPDDSGEAEAEDGGEETPEE